MDIFAVPPRLHEPIPFIEAFEETLELAETHGLCGLLLFEGSRVPFSPWVLAQHVLTRSRSLVPLVAVSPAHVSAEEAGRRIANLHHLYGRPLALNLVAGAETRTGSHADRYQELHRFSLLLNAQLEQMCARPPTMNVASDFSGGDPVAQWFVAGHSDAAVDLAAHLGAANLRMLPNTLTANVPPRCALNFGVIVRRTTVAAWAAATERYPDGPSVARVAQRVASHTDSIWKSELLSESPSAPGYWRLPAQTLKADSPFYVGSHDEVARLFHDCRTAAVSALLLDLPPSATDYLAVLRALQLSRELEEQPHKAQQCQDLPNA